MNYDEYRSAAAATAVYPGVGEGTLMALAYLGLGLAGETGEIAELVQVSRIEGDSISLDDLRHELGDVLWYDAMLINELGLQPADDPAPAASGEAAAVLGVLVSLVQATGRVAEILKKSIRSESAVPIGTIGEALADVRRHVAALGAGYGLTVGEIRTANVAKLTGRASTGTIKIHR